ncbi:6,7-dimethyl-8-ribityllumazine synthase, partial [bacterium]|nr:6,7-dimethyl-8-ribityllumazine synthase [bacterium]
MVKTIEGQLVVKGKRFGLVAGRFNEFITKKLLEGAVDTLTRHGVKEEEVEIVWVPGSFEIPYAARKMAEGGKYDSVICLGAVIRGDTPHFDYIASEVAKGVAQTALRTGVPTIFGVITADTLEQAIERAGTKAGNKGRDAALAAIEMVNLFE